MRVSSFPFPFSLSQDCAAFRVDWLNKDFYLGSTCARTGLMCVTCTDMGVLAGHNYPEKA
ncbi:MAG: hypothetical protein H9W83_09415 [Leuconostoc sp.]|nr:hypothetical protein [Leuconostoc sp.]